MITSFKGKYQFLSSFHEGSFWMPTARFCFKPPANVSDRLWFNSREHAFQAHKATSWDEAMRVVNAPSPYQAKRTGRVITCRQDWDKVKRAVMLDCMLAQFTYLGHLADQLNATGTEVIVEGNDWGDIYWGAVSYQHKRYNPRTLPVWDAEDGWLWTGRNWLGKLLMMTREVVS